VGGGYCHTEWILLTCGLNVLISVFSPEFFVYLFISVSLKAQPTYASIIKKLLLSNNVCQPASAEQWLSIT